MTEHEITLYTNEYVSSALYNIDSAIQMQDFAATHFTDRLKKIKQELDGLYRDIKKALAEEDA